MTYGLFLLRYRRFALAAAPGLALGLLAGPAIAQEQEEYEPLSRREVSRAMDLAEDHVEDAEDALEGGDLEAARAAWSQAGGLYLRVITDHPDRNDARLALARIYVHFEEWENVASTYAEAVEMLEEPEEILEAWTQMATAYSMLEDDLNTIEAGRKVMELDPNAPASVYIAVGSSLARQEQFTEAAEMAQRALELEPESAIAHSTLGQAAAAGGDFAAAESAYQRAVELDPETARAHAGLAAIYFARDDFAAAVTAATEALSRNDQLTQAYGIRGLANNALGNRQDAYGDLAMAITVNPDDPAANLAFAQVYEAQENASQASTYYRKVTDLANASPSARATAHGALGRFAIADQNYEEAVMHMEEAAAADLGSEEAKQGVGLAYFHRAKALRQVQDVAGSLAAIEKGFAAAPDNPLVAVEYGIALFSAQRVAEALPHVEAGVADYPEDGDPNDLGLAHYVLGQGRMQTNDFAGAQEQFVMASEALPTWGEPLRMLAWVHTAQIQYGTCRLKDASFGDRLQAAGVGCPAGASEQAKVDLAAEAWARAVELGAADPALAERIAVLQEVPNQIAG